MILGRIWQVDTSEMIREENSWVESPSGYGMQRFVFKTIRPETKSSIQTLFFSQRFSSVVLRKDVRMLQLEHVYPKAYNFSCTIIYSNPKTKDKTL